MSMCPPPAMPACSLHSPSASPVVPLPPPATTDFMDSSSSSLAHLPPAWTHSPPPKVSQPMMVVAQEPRGPPPSTKADTVSSGVPFPLTHTPPKFSSSNWAQDPPLT